jgi:hypothetical protein
VALLSSFVVYFVPILAVHIGTLPLGLVLLGAFHGLDDGNVGYAATSIAFVILIQVLVGIAVYWMIARFRWWKCALLAVAAPLLAIFMNAGLLVVLPALFLLERDPAREVGELAEVCRVPGVFLSHVNAGVDGMLERRGKVFVRKRKHNQWAVLSMPDCSIRDVGEIMTTTVPSVTAGGAVLYRTNNTDGFALAAPGVPIITVPAPKRLAGAGTRTPILSDDGTGLVWLDRRPDKSGPGKLNRHVLRWRPLDGDTVTTIELDVPSREQLTLIGANITANRYDVSRYRNQFLRLDGHGRAVADVIAPTGTYNPRYAFRRFEGGWLYPSRRDGPSIMSVSIRTAASPRWPCAAAPGWSSSQAV